MTEEILRIPIYQAELEDGGIKYSFYIDEIVEVDYFEPLLNVCENAQANDVIQLFINSQGGYLHTFIAIKDALDTTQAHTVAIIQSIAHSAGSMLALSCKELQVNSFSHMLIHNYTGGAYGKGQEMYDQIQFDKEFIDELYYTVYNKFLTKKEIKRVVSDNDKWLKSTEIIERWQRVVEWKEKQYNKVLKQQEKEYGDTLIKVLEEKGYKVERSKES